MANQKVETGPQPPESTGPAPPAPAGGPEVPRPAPSNRWLWIMLVILVLIVLIILVYYFLITKPTEQPQQVAPVTEEIAPTPEGIGGVPETTPAAPEGGPTEGFKLYKTEVGEEELAEPGQAINFSVAYPGDWTYRVLDEEVKRDGAGNILNFVAFGKEPPTLTQEENRMVIYADSHQFQNMVELVTYDQTAQKTETTYGGQQAVKWVGKKVSPLGTDTEISVTVVVAAPAGWSLVVEGKGADEQIIDQMLSTLVFLPA